MPQRHRTNMTVKLVHITPDAEKHIAYCARVSSPQNQTNPQIAGLLSYCLKHGHWSIFEMASMCVEIRTSRAISPQILRHRSFSFQEFSQRYSEPPWFIIYPPRRQDAKNRQNSIDDLDAKTKGWFRGAQADVIRKAETLYKKAVKKGIAKECARFLLPLSTETRLYMHGTIRSWIHYLQVRTKPDVQKEHRDIALEIKNIFDKKLPVIAEAMRKS